MGSSRLRRDRGRSNGKYILIDHVRLGHYGKRGGAAHQVSLDEAAIVFEEMSEQFVALDETLRSLAEVDSRKS